MSTDPLAGCEVFLEDKPLELLPGEVVSTATVTAALDRIPAGGTFKLSVRRGDKTFVLGVDEPICNFDPDPMLLVMINLLQTIIKTKSVDPARRFAAASLQYWFFEHAEEYFESPDKALACVGAVELLELGLELRGDVPMSGYFEQLRLELPSLLSNFRRDFS